jgi:hypothetical protein
MFIAGSTALQETNSLGWLLIVVPFAFEMGCIFGMYWCYEMMIGDIEASLAPQEEMRFPRASWNTFNVYRLHKKYFPYSRLRSSFRFLGFAAAACFGTIAIVMIYSAF